jgi:formylglycine-generating enzyme required for sulfatase activity
VTNAAIGSVTTPRCPRCSAPVGGSYKFCPACAYRLTPSAVEPVTLPPSKGGRWKTLFLASAALAAVLAAALGFVLLAYPHWLVTPPAPKPPPAEVDLSKRLLVADIPSLLVELRPGTGMYFQWEAEEDPLPVYVWYSLEVMKYETTRGMYAEFLDDLRSDPRRVPERWRIVDDVARVEDVDLFDHVPKDWVEEDEDGVPVRWSLPPEEVNLPVTGVDVNDALGFAEWASARTGVELTLPYEVEWLRAANGGDPELEWPWGTQRLFYAANTSAWWRGQRGAPLPVQWAYPEPLGSGGATREGLFSMAGNVQEMALTHDVEPQRNILDGARWLRWVPLDRIDEVYGYGGSYRMGLDDCRCRLDSRVRYSHREKREDLGFRLVAR